MCHDKDAFSWLSALSIQKHGCIIHKLMQLTSITGEDQLISYICRRTCNVEHSLSCSFGLSDIMKFIMLLLTFYLKFTQMYKLNHSFNQFLGKHCPILLSTPMIIPGWIYLSEVFRTLLMREHLLT